MPSIEFIIKANYKEVDKAIKKIEDLKKIISSMKDTDPGMEKLEAEYREAQETIKKMANEIASLTTKQIEQESITRKQTSGLSEQTRIYKDMSSVITSVLGSRDQIAQKIVEEVNALAQLKAQMKQVNEERKNEILSSSEASTQMSRLIVKEKEHKQTLSDLERTIKSQTKEFLVATTSITGMSQQLSQMRTIYNRLSEESRNSSFGKSLLSEIQALDQKLKQLDASIGNYQRNVGNYASGYNGLQNAMQQVIRETPSLAVSLNTFFLAISNNLPILADEISRAIKELELLKAQGKAGIPVWRQVAKSLISWQTALVAAVSLLAIYGKDIADWITGLFVAKKALSETYKTTEDFNKNVSETSGNTIATLEKMSAAWKKLGGDIKAQEKFILDNKDAFDSTGTSINSVKEAENLLINNKAAFVESIIAKAKATATMKLASEEYVRYLEKMREAEAMPEERTYYVQNGMFGGVTSYTGKNLKKTATEEEAKKYLESFNALINDVITAEEEGTEKLKEAGINLTNSLVEGSVGAIKAAITKKQQELEKVVDPKEYQRIETEIKAEQAKLEAITGKSTKEENAISDQRNRILELMSKNAIARIKEEIDLENQVAQERINAMDEGYDKELAQRELNNKKELQALQRQKEEYIRAYKQAQKEIFEAQEDLKAKQNPNYKKQTFDSTSVSPQTSVFDAIEFLTRKRQSADLAKYYKDLLSKYQDYTAKRLEAQKKFDKDRTALENAGASQERISELEYQRKETYDAIDSEFAIRQESFQVWADNVANLSLEKLREMLMLAKEELQRQEFINPNDPKLATMRAKVATLENTIGIKQATQNNVSPGKRTIKEWQNLYSTLQKVDKEFDEIGDAVGGTVGEIIKAAGNISSSTLQMIDSIVTLSNWSTIATERAAEGATEAIIKVEQASVILTVISAALKIATSIISLFKRTDYMAEFRKEMAKLNHELEITKLNARIGENEYDSIFGEDLWKNAKKNINAANDALQRFNETQNNAANRKKYTGLIGLIAEAEGVKNSYNSIAESVADMQIQIRHSTWFRSAKYQSLKDAVPELFNDNGSVNMDALEKFLGTDTFKKLSEENQKYLQEMSDYWKSYQEAIEEVRGYLTDIFGDLGNTMTDALVDAWVNGTDAAKSYVDSVSDMLETLAKQMVYSVTLGPLMKKAQQDMLDTMQEAGLTDEQKFNKWSNILNNLVNDAVNQQSLANKLLKDYQKMAAEKGFDIFTPDSSDQSDDRTAKAKGLASMSQDTGEKLDGKFTAGLIYLDKMTTSSYDIAGSIKDLTRQSYDGWKNVEAIKELSSDIKNINNRIADNTEDIGAILKTIRSDTKGMNEDVSYVRTNGLYVKR